MKKCVNAVPPGKYIRQSQQWNVCKLYRVEHNLKSIHHNLSIKRRIILQTLDVAATDCRIDSQINIDIFSGGGDYNF